MNRLFKLWGSVLALALVALGSAPLAASASTGGTNADPVTHSTVVSATPSALTPNIDDGTVLAFAQLGNIMVVGGHFTGVTDSVAHYARKNLLAFDVTTGNLITAFAPTLDGDVNSLVPGPTPARSSWVASSTSSPARVQGTGHARRLDRCPHHHLQARRHERQRQRHQARRQPPVRRRHLHHAGRRRAQRHRHTERGDRRARPVVVSNVAQHHNWTTGSSGSMGLIGVTDLAITPDGTHMVAIGNFKPSTACPATRPPCST